MTKVASFDTTILVTILMLICTAIFVGSSIDRYESHMEERLSRSELAWDFDGVVRVPDVCDSVLYKLFVCH